MTVQAEKKPELNKARLMSLATYAATGVAVFLVIIKFLAFIVTGSVALLGSLIDSLLDGIASIINMVAVRHSLQPADHEHRFGHGKAEAIAGLGQAAFIIGSALFLVFESISRLYRPEPVSSGYVGLAVIVFSICLTAGLVTFQKYVVDKTGSVAISADSLHYRGDLFMNIAVLAALFLSSFGGWPQADPVFAIGIAGYIGYSAWQIFRISYDQLMDRELPDEDRDKIRSIAIAHDDVVSLHDLRTRKSGTDVFIQLHLELDPNMTLLDAHTVADQVEESVRQVFPDAQVLIHQDPAGQEEVPLVPDSLNRT